MRGASPLRLRRRACSLNASRSPLLSRVPSPLLPKGGAAATTHAAVHHCVLRLRRCTCSLNASGSSLSTGSERGNSSVAPARSSVVSPSARRRSSNSMPVGLRWTPVPMSLSILSMSRAGGCQNSCRFVRGHSYLKRSAMPDVPSPQVAPSLTVGCGASLRDSRFPNLRRHTPCRRCRSRSTARPTPKSTSGRRCSGAFTWMHRITLSRAPLDRARAPPPPTSSA
ncbi:MAG: hypothetical protein J3K34DRAFT_435480 [Monoraphidium minutum]|nr:MAG: hypothetical protein J3K34DRAFT_435480 [Monoraphidium minutum]